MRIIIEETPETLTCRVTKRVGNKPHSLTCSTFSNCDKKTKQRVKTILMTVLIRITNGEMDKQAKELLERLVLEQRRKGEGTVFKKSNTTKEL
jgi:hypothetical protein